MKPYKILLTAAVVASLGAALSSCDDDLAYPPAIVPEATITPNTSILDLKTRYWSDERNYADTIGYVNRNEHLVIAGRVISSGETGNVYKSLIIQDSTAALAFSINSSSLYETYRVGQEVVIDMTGMCIGKYNGLQQVGKPEPYQSTMEISFMELEAFQQQAQFNGMPEVGAPDCQPVTMTFAELNASTKPEHLCRYMSRLVKFEDVSFEGGGTLTFSEPNSSTNRYLVDASGQKMLVRNSNYASFATQKLPAGRGTVVCIASYYGTSWQLMIRDLADLTGFNGEGGNTPTPDQPGDKGNGTAEAPYTVQAVQGGAQGENVWVTGYIVGFIPGKVMSEAVFGVADAANTNLVLAPTADTRDVAKCIPVALVGSLRDELGLGNQPQNLGKQVSILGDLTKYFGENGLKNTTAYNWGAKGVAQDAPDVPTGSGAFTQTTSLVSGAKYVLAVNGKVGEVIGKSLSYGRLAMVEPTSLNGNTLVTALTNEITITAVSGGYVMVDCYGRYLSMDDSHFTSFQLYTTQQVGSVWTAAFEGSNIVLTNTLNPNCRVGQSMGSDGTPYTNIAPSADDKINLPTLYMLN